VYKEKSKLSLVSSNQDKELISSSKKHVLLFLRENQSGEESLKVNTSLEGCNKEHKHHLEEFLHAYMGVFQNPKGIPPNMEVEHGIQLLPDSSLPNIEMYR
jgi:hypothetical protein